MEKNRDRKSEFFFIKFFEKDENILYEIQGCMKPQPIHDNITKIILKIQHTICEHGKWYWIYEWIKIFLILM